MWRWLRGGGGGCVVFARSLRKEKTSKKSKQKFAKFPGQGRYNNPKQINIKKNCQAFILSSQFLYLARKDLRENFVLGILFVFILYVLPFSFFFLIKYQSEIKKVKKVTLLTNNFPLRFCLFFLNKSFQNSKNSQEEPTL